MSSVWEKLFGNSQTPANDYPSSEDKRAAAPALSVGGPGVHTGGQIRSPEPTPKSTTVARTFDSIGRRNENLRAQLDAVELSFRNIETIRSQFYDALTPIDQTLAEIERTKVAHLDAERKVEALTEAHEQLKGEHANVTLDRNALLAKQEELTARVKDLERTVAAAEASAADSRAAITDRNAKLERTERDLEDNRRRLHTVSEQLPALRAEFAAKEKRLQEVEQLRANLHDQYDLLNQESHSLRTRIEDLVANGSKLNRQLGEVESRRGDLARRVEDLEAALSQETAAHAKLKGAHLDAAEAHRLTASNLREELSAMSLRSAAAERLLNEARDNLREREAAIRGFEQRALESSLAAKARETAFADLEKDLAAARAQHAEVEAARSTLDQRSADLATALEDKEAVLHRAEHKIETLEARIAEQTKAMSAERALHEERLGKLKEQLEGEQSARAFAEGALKAAREERGARRSETEGVTNTDGVGASGGAPPKELPNVVSDGRDKIARLRG
jgi:chromosome segregation ATPase